ncbi:WD40-repeat-containing domain protein [Kalaharituber pfeilii]|nr:WD40-repeat-containing domain protein [Kalaharituber pfeilii]
MVSSARKPRDRDPQFSTSRRRSLRNAKAAESSSNKSTSGSAKICWDDRYWKLFLATATKVCVWDGLLCATVFTSGSEGILAAKRSKDGSFLAVADSQIVVLHKVEQGQHRSYPLKSADGACRLLQYAHDSRSLFFTDNIHNSVQTYSLREDRVNEAAKAHPSPVTSFCVSSDSNFLLSCSSSPSVIHLHNRQLNTTVEIRPKASSKPVLCCTFHPTRKYIFLLAFADGVVAAYDSNKLIRGDKARAAARKGDIGSGGGEHIHSFGHLHDASNSDGAGITGVEFIPGFRSRAVSIGDDGRLFILDFEKKEVLGSWHVGAPATCLSVRPAKDAGKSGNEEGWMVAVGTIHGKCFVFDGDGTKVCEQTVDADAGKVLDVEWVTGEVAMPPGIGAPNSVSSSWKSGIKSPSSRYPDSISSGAGHANTSFDVLITKSQNQTLPSLTENAERDSSTTLNGISTKPPVLPELPRLPWQDLIETSKSSYMNMFSPVKKTGPSKAKSVAEKESENVNEVEGAKEHTLRQEDQRNSISAPALEVDKPTGKKHDLTPETTDTGSVGQDILDDSGSRELSDPTPIAKASGDLSSSTENIKGSSQSAPTGITKPATSNAMVPVKSVSSTVTSTKVTDPGKLLRDIRSIRGDSEKGSGPRGLALFAPYMGTSKRGILKSFGTGKHNGNVGDSSSLSLGLDGDSNSEVKPSERSTFLLDESTIKDDTINEDENPKIESGEVEQQHRPYQDSAEPQPESRLEQSEESDNDADIWLIQGMDEESTSTRKSSDNKPSPAWKRVSEGSKRKLPAEEDYGPGPGLSAGAGTAQSQWGSNKSRKITPATSGSNRADSALKHYGLSPHKSHISSTLTATTNEASSLSLRDQVKNTSRGVSSGTVLIGKEANQTISAPSHLPSKSTSQGMATGTLQGIIPASAWETFMNRMLGEMRESISTMHHDMTKRFEEQKTMIEEFRKEMLTIRTENERLRRELFEIMGGKSRNVSGKSEK